MTTAQPCPNLEENKKQCACPNTACANHGLCCACVRYHRADGSPPMCLR